ncbi:hypothetical protein cyc_07618 [Cyclospora cayetanensis]|uniref:Uncharacterized protein n=1 Tax=Cyclospora cayetanensis TaxID=88456 RepID=A0A1D3D7R6_9EIME|nr:hypothetical protein cyc_07618 [Cyclospora cayetanensis]
MQQQLAEELQPEREGESLGKDHAGGEGEGEESPQQQLQEPQEALLALEPAHQQLLFSEARRQQQKQKGQGKAQNQQRKKSKPQQQRKTHHQPLQCQQATSSNCQGELSPSPPPSQPSLLPPPQQPRERKERSGRTSRSVIRATKPNQLSAHEQPPLQHEHASSSPVPEASWETASNATSFAADLFDF